MENFPTYYQPPTKIKSHSLTADICVYGATSSGIIAATHAAKSGLSVVVLEPSKFIGGMSASGLGMTDLGESKTVGGLTEEFYNRQRKSKDQIGWRVSPKKAKATFEELLSETNVEVHKGEFLASVVLNGTWITSLSTESGLQVTAKYFIDATYEGDLMAMSGVSYTVGRESNQIYNERWNGVQPSLHHQFMFPVDPYIEAGKPKSGLLPGISTEPLAAIGSGDKHIQAYNFRLCLTNNPKNRIAYPKPANYNRSEYILLERYIAGGFPSHELFMLFDPIEQDKPGFTKVDKNNQGAVSTDFIGRNHAWPEADYQTRQRIYQEHINYQLGLMWFLGNDKSVPTAIRRRWNQWGLTADEFEDTCHWPHHLYVREARRMVSDYVMTDHNFFGQKIAEDPVGLASYALDSHNCQRVVDRGFVLNEGNVQISPATPYPVSYRSIIPKVGDVSNLFVPVCLSASHIAYGSIRMEPVFMVLGQSAAIAATLAIDQQCSVQEVSYSKLRHRLKAARQALNL